jgi:adenine-specific DNA-methyltransferase
VSGQDLPQVEGLAPYASGSGWQVYQADVLTWLAAQPEHSAHLIVCDPPYHRVLDAEWDKRWPTPEAYLGWVGELVDAIARALHPTGSLYLFASARMGGRVEVAVAERLAVLNHIAWHKTHNGAEAHRGSAQHKEGLRAFVPGSERIIFAEHANSDGHAMSGAGYTLACDRANGSIIEPLRAYLDGERARAGVSPRKISGYFAERGWPEYIYRHWFTASQWELPTAENYQRLRECLNALGSAPAEYLRRDYEDLRRDYEDLRRDYEDLRRDYEDLRRDYEDLRRPHPLTAERPWYDNWPFRPVPHYAGKHPAEKPRELADHIIASSARLGCAVSDLCAGSAPFAVAAVRAGLPAVAVDESAHWCEVAAERLRAATHA